MFILLYLSFRRRFLEPRGTCGTLKSGGMQEQKGLLLLLPSRYQTVQTQSPEDMKKEIQTRGMFLFLLRLDQAASPAGTGMSGPWQTGKPGFGRWEWKAESPGRNLHWSCDGFSREAGKSSLCTVERVCYPCPSTSCRC